MPSHFRDLVMNSEKPSWGLIVLLVSKAGGHDESISVIDKDLTAGRSGNHQECLRRMRVRRRCI